MDEWEASCRNANWGEVPDRFNYVVGPAEKYAIRVMVPGYEPPLELSKDELMELGECASKIAKFGHWDELTRWTAQTPGASPSYARILVSTLIELMDENGLKMS